jgi:hypothetical protein
MEPDPCDKSVVRVPHHAAGTASDAQTKIRPQNQCGIGARVGRLTLQGGLCRRQTWHRRSDQGNALETAEEGITCNAICPGYVYTPLVEAQIDGQAKVHGISRDQVIRDVLLAQQPNKRFATVGEIGALTVFLASDAAASITGTALPVDGGWTAH